MQPMLPVDAAHGGALVTDAIGSSVGGPVPIKAREGRQHQRYNTAGERLVAGYVWLHIPHVVYNPHRWSRCIPYRLRNTELPTVRDAQVLLVSSRGGKAWSFPKVRWPTR